jgi:hypothetical protein
MPIARALPTATADGLASATPSRTGTYGEAYVLPISNKEFAACDEGSYFIALTPTPGTGIIGTVNIAAITAASPTMVIYNGHGSKYLYPQFLNLHETVVSTTGARSQFTFYTDAINRYTSSGTALTISNTNSGSANSASLVVAQVGTAMVATAASGAQRLIAHVVFRGTIDVAEDQLEFVFGGLGGGNAGSSRAATVTDFSKTLPPVALAPGHSLVMHQWAGSQANAPTFEYQFGFILR